MEIKVRKATLKDLKDIQKLNHILCIKEYNEFDKTINKDYPIQKEGEDYFRQRIQDEYAIVAVDKDKVVGYLVGAICEPEDYRTIGKLGEAENMLVLEEYRGKGIGKKLMSEFERWCKGKKVKRIKVVASAQNMATLGFYRNEGFEDVNVCLEKDI